MSKNRLINLVKKAKEVGQIKELLEIETKQKELCAKQTGKLTKKSVYHLPGQCSIFPADKIAVQVQIAVPAHVGSNRNNSNNGECITAPCPPLVH